MSLEGAKVVGCVELCPYSNGLNRNIVQCLNDYDIPLYLSHTITDIQGDKRVEKVIVSKVDEKNQPIPRTEMEFDVDTVLLSVGLIPENELTRSAGITMDPATSGPVVYENMETSAEGSSQVEMSFMFMTQQTLLQQKARRQERVLQNT